MARYGGVNRGRTRAIPTLRSSLAFLALVSLGVHDAARPATAQDLEPRAFSPAPIGLNFAALGYAYSWGNVLFDPAIPITDGDANVHSLVGAYLRTIDFFGMSGKVDAVVPYAIHGKWTGLVEGVPDSTTRSGFGDPSFRLSVNFIGAPALDLPDFARHKYGTIVGASLQVRAPLGEYDPTKLINLGSNRWTFKPRLANLSAVRQVDRGGARHRVVLHRQSQCAGIPAVAGPAVGRGCTRRQAVRKGNLGIGGSRLHQRWTHSRGR